MILGFSEKGGIDSDKLNEGVNRLMARLLDEGCILSGLELEYSLDSTTAYVKINNGQVPITGRITISGNSQLGSSYLESLLQVHPGRRISNSMVFKDLENIAKAYADNGYPHAQINTGDFVAEGDRIEFKYIIEEGPRVILENVLFAGNQQTRDVTLRRLFGFVPNKPFNRRTVEKGRGNLIKSGLFRSVSEPMLVSGSADGRENIFIKIEEGRYNNIFGTLGYNRDETRQKGWMTGSVDLAFSNLGGYGRKAKVSWQRLRQENSRLTAEFYTPWIFSFNLAVTAGVSHRIEDSTYTQSSGRILAEIPAGDHFTVGAGGEIVRVVPGSSMSVLRSTKYNSLWTLGSDFRGGPSGRSGFASRLEIEYGRKNYYDPSSQLTLSRIKFDAAHSQEITGKQSFYLAGHSRAVISSERPVPRYDQFSMGGAATLRGYWEEQFTANQLFWINAEYRYAPDRRLEIFPLFDLGYFYDPERMQRGYRFGYGAGLRMDTSLGWLNLIYALGEGDNMGQGKVHVSLDSVF